MKLDEYTLWLYYAKLIKAYISETSFVEFSFRRGSLKIAMRSIIVFTVDVGADELAMLMYRRNSGI